MASPRGAPSAPAPSAPTTRHLARADGPPRHLEQLVGRDGRVALAAHGRHPLPHLLGVSLVLPMRALPKWAGDAEAAQPSPVVDRHGLAVPEALDALLRKRARARGEIVHDGGGS